MLRMALLALCVATLPSGARAVPPEDQLFASVSRDLRIYFPDVDPSTLDRGQLAAIYSILHSNASSSEKTGLIRSVIGGKFSLRGLLFN